MSQMPYPRVVLSGLPPPAVSLGVWQTFGHEVAIELQQKVPRRAFDLGVTHFDRAKQLWISTNNWGGDRLGTVTLTPAH